MKKECNQCGIEFSANHGKQKFCSDKCKVAYGRRSPEDKLLGSVIGNEMGCFELSEVESVDLPITVVKSDGKLGKSASRQAIARIDDHIAELNKRFGAGTVMRLGDAPMKGVDVISTGSLALDRALGVMGLPKGRMVEIFGPESSGKTTIALHVIAEAQKRGMHCAFIDAEHAFDSGYASAIGVDVKNLVISQPDSGEQALELADSLISEKAYGVVVIDSVAALTPKSEIEGEMGDSKMGLHARLMSQACRKLTAVVSKSNTLLIFINQIRMKIGMVWGNPETTTGGRALAFYTSVRLDVRNLGKEGEKGDYTGNKTKVTVAKNKCAPPFKVAEFGIVYGEGIDKAGEVLDLGVSQGVLRKGGNWYYYEETTVGNGRDVARKTLMDNPELYELIKSKL